jgi:hypothetical protein
VGSNPTRASKILSDNPVDFAPFRSRHLQSSHYLHLGEEHMADIERIGAQQAHTKAKSNQALLVCAYEDEAKCRMLNLDGSISFTSLQSRAASLPKTQEIIFY